MLRYLTYKLKTQTLDESDSYHKKNDDDHDSGTESDDESADAEELESYMGDSSHQDASSAPSDRASSTLETITDTTEGGRTSDDRQQLSAASKTDVESPLPEQALDSALPSDSDHNFDHHSSEEELEVINCRSRNSSGNYHHHQREKQSQQYPEKRKWSQANRLSLGDCYNSGSSDEEVRDLMCVSAPVEFRSSPPANVPKPSRSLSPPPKLFHHASSAHIPPHELCSVSPRKRHRRNIHRNHDSASSTNVQRPSLDFEKMQQVSVDCFVLKNVRVTSFGKKTGDDGVGALREWDTVENVESA